MAKQIGPRVRCLVIGGSLGPKSPNIGREVVVLNKHPNPKPHSLWGFMWQCASSDGKPFLIKRDHSEEFGPGRAEQNIADFAEDWLQPLEEEPAPPVQMEQEKELTK